MRSSGAALEAVGESETDAILQNGFILNQAHLGVVVHFIWKISPTMCTLNRGK